MIKERFAGGIKVALFIGAVAGSIALAIHFSSNKNPFYFTRKVEVLGEQDHQKTVPRKSFYVRMADEGPTEAVDFDVPFRIGQLWWWENAQGTEFRIELTGQANPESATYQRCGYTIEITVNDNQQVIWYGHNLRHTALKELGQEAAALARMADGSLIAHTKVHRSGNVLWMVLPVKGVKVNAVRLFYIPSKEAFESSAKQMVMVSSWLKDPSTWGNRVRRIPGNLSWVDEPTKQPD
jgi:hypothetical protein